MVEVFTFGPLDEPLKGLRLTGELDIAAVPSLDEALAALAGDARVTLDISGLTFIDSSGLHAILQFASSLDGEGLTLANPSEGVLRLLEIVRMNDHPAIRIA